MNDDEIVKIKRQLEDELAVLMLKYSDRLKSGEINESILGFIVCMACSLSYRLNKSRPMKEVEDHHIRWVKENIERSRKHYEGN